MKQIYLTLLLALLTTLGAQAETVTIDGIRYELDANTNEATVMSNSPKYSGSITIPPTVNYNSKAYQVTTIGNYAFEWCKALTSVTIPNSVTTIGSDAFRECTGLTSVTIGNSVASIGMSAFYGCTGLTSIHIPNSVTSIGYSAFYGCTGLTSITIPNSVTTIDSDAFRECTGLTSVTIGNSVTSIGSTAFYGCTGLTSITICSGLTTINRHAFQYCTGLTYINVQNGNPKYDSRDNCNAIIETATNTLVFGCKNTTIPNSVTSIDQEAFYSCTGLTAITIPNSVTSIGNYAFAYCTGLTSITIPNSVTNIGKSAFSGCTGLYSITIGNSVTSIGQEAFSSCTDLTSFTVQNGNPKYDSRRNCNALVETATNTLVCGCKKTIIPNSVTSIGDYAFQGCKGLTSITIPNSVTSIGKSAFWGCTGLTSITVPNSVTSIHDYAFADCTGLTSITVQNENPKYDSRDNCNAIIKTATNTLVSGCKNTTIPNNVTTIGGYSFYGCKGLTSITIPNSVTRIDDYAFCNCTNLSYIRSEIDVPFEIHWSVFKYYTNVTYETINATLYVPAGTKSAYEATSGWNQLNIEEAILYPSCICSREDEQVELPITLDNVDFGENVAGVSFTLQLPEGVSVALDEDGDPVWSFISERVNKKQFSVVPAQYDDGTWGFRVYTTSGTGVIMGTEGAFMTIMLNVADGVADGNYTILLKENKLSVKDASNNVSSVVVANVPSTLTIKNYKKGDVNDDGEIDLSDAIMVTYYSLHAEPSDFIRKAADMNGDGEIDLSDAILIIYKSLGMTQTQSMPSMGDALYAVNYLQSRRASATQESVSVDNVSLKAGEEAVLDINYQLPDDGIYVGFMFKVDLPEGLSLVEDPDYPGYPWYDDEVAAISKMSITTTTTGGFAATPKTGSATIKGNSGVLMRLKVRAAEGLAPGNYTARLTDLSFNLRDENYNVTKSKLADVTFDVAVTDGNEGKKGDVNGDGAVDIADVVAVYNIMAGNNQSGYNGDVNQDGATDIADVVAIYNIMAGGN